MGEPPVLFLSWRICTFPLLFLEIVWAWKLSGELNFVLLCTGLALERVSSFSNSVYKPVSRNHCSFGHTVETVQWKRETEKWTRDTEMGVIVNCNIAMRNKSTMSLLTLTPPHPTKWPPKVLRNTLPSPRNSLAASLESQCVGGLWLNLWAYELCKHKPGLMWSRIFLCQATELRNNHELATDSRCWFCSWTLLNYFSKTLKCSASVNVIEIESRRYGGCLELLNVPCQLGVFFIFCTCGLMN